MLAFMTLAYVLAALKNFRPVLAKHGLKRAVSQTYQEIRDALKQ